MTQDPSTAGTAARPAWPWLYVGFVVTAIGVPVIGRGLRSFDCVVGGVVSSVTGYEPVLPSVNVLIAFPALGLSAAAVVAGVTRLRSWGLVAYAVGALFAAGGIVLMFLPLANH